MIVRHLIRKKNTILKLFCFVNICPRYGVLFEVRCTVFNVKLVSYWQILFLSVLGAPLPPINVLLTDCTKHSTNITWDLRLPSDFLPTAFIIEWRLKPYSTPSMLPELNFSKLAEIPGSNRFYLVNNLTPWRYIEFRMRAKNSLGEGFPSKILGGCRTGAKRKYKDHHLTKMDPVSISPNSFSTESIITTQGIGGMILHNLSTTLNSNHTIIIPSL